MLWHGIHGFHGILHGIPGILPTGMPGILPTGMPGILPTGMLGILVLFLTYCNKKVLIFTKLNEDCVLKFFFLSFLDFVCQKKLQKTSLFFKQQNDRTSDRNKRFSNTTHFRKFAYFSLLFASIFLSSVF